MGDTFQPLGKYVLRLVVRLQFEDVARIGLGLTAVDRVESFPQQAALVLEVLHSPHKDGVEIASG